jgi:hypothetical protein
MVRWPKMKESTFNLIIGALPLLIYPPVFIAGIMSLAGQHTWNEPIFLMLAAYGFLLTSLAYPLVYLICIFKTLRQKNKDDAIRWSLTPLIYLLAVIALMFLWVFTGKVYR